MSFPLLNRQATPPEKTEEVIVPGPADNYTYRLNYVPSLERTPVVSIPGFTLVQHLPTSATEVYLKTGTGDLIFYYTQSGNNVGIATYNALGSLIDADTLNLLNELSSVENLSLAIPGIPSSGQLVGSIYVQGRGNAERRITRITVSAGDTLDVTGDTVFSITNGTDTVLLTLPQVESKATDSVELVLDLDSSDLWLPVTCETSGGHGNFSLNIEVQL